MGCSSSTLNDNDGKGKPKGPGPVLGPLIIPTVTWEKVEPWEEFCQKAIATETETTGDLLDLQFQVARNWLAQMYPECDRLKTIEPMGDIFIPTSYGPCKYKGKHFLTLDSNYTGVVFSLTLVLALPLAENGESKFEVGAALDSPEMEAAKQVMLKMMALMEQRAGNYQHAELYVIIGADMLRCKYKSGYQEPSITQVPENNAAKSAAIMDDLARKIRKDSDARLALAGKFTPMTFRNAVKALQKMHPGCTVWDGGDFPFNVGNIPYALPTRLLVVRQFENTADETAATHYSVLTSDTTPEDEKVSLVRGSRPEQAFDGTVVHLELFVAIPPDVIWPKTGDYAKKPVMKSATATLLYHLKQLNQVGKLHRCVVEVEMGTDRLKLSFVGDKIEPVASETNQTAASKAFTSLDGFSIILKEQPKHELFESEGQFQAIKEMMQERARQDPDRFTASAPMVAQMAATHFLEANYPGCKISDEGEAPFTHEGQTFKLSDTRLVIATEPSKSKNNIVAALLLVPLPGGITGGWAAATEKKWTDTMEMKEAEKALLAVLKQWYKEEKIAEDCLAQVMMGMDAAIYRFVDGERFEDYDDERMSQLRWG